MFEDPGVIVRNEYGVDPGSKGGIDVGLGAVADHPGALGLELVFGNNRLINGRIFFRNNLHGPEVFLHA